MSNLSRYHGRMIRLAAIVCGAALAVVVHAEGFPDKPVRFVVGFTPGGPSDIIAREILKWAKVVKESGARAE